jgi:glycosyltransferase involved in cell wall biosynthesis
MIPLNILLIIPRFNKENMDNAWVYKFLAESDNQIIVITSKGIGGTRSPIPDGEYEEFYDIKIYRYYDAGTDLRYNFMKYYLKIRNIVENFKPDVILCSQQGNLPLAYKLKKEFKVPIVLIVEHFYSPHWLIGRRLGKLPFIARIGAELDRRWIISRCDVIINSDPSEVPFLAYLNKYGTPVYHIRWPCYLPKIKRIEKDENIGVYAGSLALSKNIKEFVYTIPQILKNSHIKKFYILGLGQSSIINDINKKNKKYNVKGELKYIPNMSREETLKLISAAFFGYTPVAGHVLGGFPVECLALKTPLIATHNILGLEDHKNILITTPEKIADSINELYKDSKLYGDITENAREFYQKNHDPKIISKKYMDVIIETMSLYKS